MLYGMGCLNRDVYYSDAEQSGESLPCIIMEKQQQYVPGEEEREVLIQLKIYIDSDLRKQHSNKELSSISGLNRTKLCNGFKVMFGCTIYQYIIQQRIELSKQLLLTGGKEIKDISYQCGYKTVQHFGTVFKKSVGVTPKEFQRIHN